MRRIILLSFAILLTACATVGTKFDPAAVSKLQTGVSTLEDATLLLGPHTSYSKTLDGQSTYIWTYAEATFGGSSNSRAVYLVFDQDGKLQSATVSESNL